MASGESLGSTGQDYELNILEHGLKGCHLGGARSLLPSIL